MNRYRPLGRLAACSTLLLALTACVSGGADTDDDTLRVGYIGGASGFSAAFGVPTREGVEAAIEDINQDGGILGREVELVVADDKGDPNASQTAMRRLASDGVQYVVSGSSSAATLAHQNVATQNEMLVVSPIGSDPAIIENQEGTPWYFVNVPSNDQLGEAVAEYAVEANLSSVVVFERDDAYGVSTTEGFVDAAEKGGTDVEEVITYAIDKKEFGSDLVKALRDDPDALFLSGYAEDSGLIAKQARAAGFQGKLLGTSPLTADQYIEVAGGAAADQTYVSTASALLVQSNADAEQLDFAKRWAKENGNSPNDYQLAAYDSVFALKNAIEEADSVDPEQARDALLDVEFDGVSGLVGFDDEGASRRSVYVVERRSGDWADPATD